MSSKHVVVTFGRASPITAGHQKLFDKVAETAKKVGGEGHIHLSQSFDSKKNPLSHDTKVDLAKKMMPHHAKMFHNEKKVKTLFDVMKHHSDPEAELHVIAGSDRVEEYKKKLNDYNGKDYHYKKIHVHSAGDRDPDAEGAEGISGTKMRMHAANGNFSEFKKGAPTTAKPEHVEHMYNEVRANQSMRESDEIDTVHDDLFEGFGDAENRAFRYKEMAHELRHETAAPKYRDHYKNFSSTVSRPKATGLIYHAGGSKEDKRGKNYDFHYGDRETGHSTAKSLGGSYQHFKTLKEFVIEAEDVITQPNNEQLPVGDHNPKDSTSTKNPEIVAIEPEYHEYQQRDDEDEESK